MHTRANLGMSIAGLLLLAVCGGPGRAQAGGFCLSFLVDEASAQEVMKFERISPESAAALEEQRDAAAAREARLPQPPEPPEPPEISHGGDVVRIGSDIHIERSQVVEGDVFTLRGDIRIDGHVKGNVATMSGDVLLGPTAKVDGDVMCIGGELTEEQGAFVGGQRVTALRGRRDRALRQEIRDRVRDGMRDGGNWDAKERGGAVGFSLSWLLFSTLMAWLITKIAPTRSGVALDALRQRPGSSLGVGFLMLLLLGPSVVALALAMAILCITIIGIPLALLLFPAYGLLLTLVIVWGFVLGASVVGQQMTGRWPTLMSGSESIRRHAVLGALGVSGMLLASAILRFLPFFGWISTLLWVLGWVTFGFITLAGAGALLRSKFGLGPEGRWWPPFAPGPKPAPAAPAAAPPSAPPPPPAPPPSVSPMPENPPATS